MKSRLHWGIPDNQTMKAKEMQLDFVAILPFAICVFVAGIFWAILDFSMNRKTRAESRLEAMRNRLKGKPDVEKSDGKIGLTRLLEAASPSLSEPLKPKSEKEIGTMTARLHAAGFRHEGALAMFTTIKALFAIAGFIIGGGTSLIMNGMNLWTMIYTLVAAGGGLFIPEFALTFLAAKRKESIFLGLPDALDLMVVCVEAGLGLDQAMRKVAEELARSHRTISYEFKICNQALQMGRPRAEVLRDLGERNGVDDLKTLSQIIIQVDKFGTSVGQALRTQSETMRTRRRQIAEEKAAKTAVKLIFPLVLFIFPGIFVVLVGPAAITMVNEMLPTFQK
ncbi:MAG: type II secretion system F family protein [Pirellulaceae bacterium]